MTGIFLFNYLHSGKISDKIVADVLFYWFKIDSKQSQITASRLDPLDECFLDELDINFRSFNFDFNYTSNPITMGKRFLYIILYIVPRATIVFDISVVIMLSI